MCIQKVEEIEEFINKILSKSNKISKMTQLFLTEFNETFYVKKSESFNNVNIIKKITFINDASEILSNQKLYDINVLNKFKKLLNNYVKNS